MNRRDQIAEALIAARIRNGMMNQLQGDRYTREMGGAPAPQIDMNRMLQEQELRDMPPRAYQPQEGASPYDMPPRAYQPQEGASPYDMLPGRAYQPQESDLPMPSGDVFQDLPPRQWSPLDYPEE